MAAITNLYARYTAPVTLGRNLPILVIMHGYTQNTNFVATSDEQRIASYGVFVLNVGLRSSDNASGTKDNCRRDVFDIYDAVIQARTTFYGLVSQTLVGISGYSGGGGHALAVACKFPDFWNMVSAAFPMSDFGRDATDGWWANNGSGAYTGTIEARNGGSPATVPDTYYANDATAAIQNYTGGHLYLWHDKQDTAVPWVHSNRIKGAMDAAGLSNYSASFSDTGDAVRWLHIAPTAGQNIVQIEPTITGSLKSNVSWTIPVSGTIKVIGYIVTKRFTIWLNTGLDAAATVVYDTVAGTYTVTPLTSNAVMAVTITQGALSASGNTNGATLFTVA